MTGTVLVPIDGSPLSYRALRHALETFDGAELVVLHVSNVFEPDHRSDLESVHEPPIGSEEWYATEREATEALLAEAEEVAADYDRTITTDSEIGDPQRIIPDYAREESIDHVVLGVHGRDEERRSLVGRVAEAVVFRSPVPVTVVR
jgi:nucleotide-binding universal stress UspA family protein